MCHVRCSRPIHDQITVLKKTSCVIFAVGGGWRERRLSDVVFCLGGADEFAGGGERCL